MTESFQAKLQTSTQKI